MVNISISQLAIYTADQLEGGVDSSQVAKNIAAYLLKEKRTRDAPKLYRAIEKELSRRGKTQVTITSAHSVSEQTKKQLAQLLGVDNPLFNEVIDQKVIGGVNARANESEIDLTVRGRLNKFKQQVIRSN